MIEIKHQCTFLHLLPVFIKKIRQEVFPACQKRSYPGANFMLKVCIAIYRKQLVITEAESLEHYKT